MKNLRTQLFVGWSLLAALGLSSQGWAGEPGFLRPIVPGAGSPYERNGLPKPDWGIDAGEAGDSGQPGVGFQGIYENSTRLPTFAFLAMARRSIDIEIYEMRDPDFRAALRQAIAKRIRIRVVKDALPLGEACRWFEPVGAQDTPDCQDQKRLVAEVQASGGFFVPFNKSALCGIPGRGCFEHGKMILIDDRYALLSTGNFNSSSFCNQRQNPSRCNRDYSYLVADPRVVATLRSIFERDLLGAAYDLPSLLTPAVQTKMTVSPFSLQPLVEFIQSARFSIVLQNQYLKEPTINQALMEAARRGVRVFINLASLCAFGPPTPSEAAAATALFQQFDQAGVHSRFFTSGMLVNGRPGYLHAKAIVVDGRFAWMGSVNGSTTSVSMNREFGVFFKNPRMVTYLAQVMASDITHPQSESWRESLACAKDLPAPPTPPGD